MKVMLLIAFFLLLFVNVNAQNYTTEKIIDSTNNPTKFLFSDYSSGIVFLKNGNRVETKLNYQMDNQSFYYLNENNSSMELSNVEDVDTIFLGSMKFIPINKKFYYLVLKDKVSLLSSFFGKAIPMVYSYDKSGLKMKEAGEVSTDLTNTYSLMHRNNVSKLQFNLRYWLLEGNSIKKVNSVKQILGNFKHVKQGQIDNYLKDNKVDFNSTLAVGNFVKICNTLAY